MVACSAFLCFAVAFVSPGPSRNRGPPQLKPEEYDRFILQPIGEFAQASIAKLEAGPEIQAAIETTKTFKEWYEKGQAWKSDLLLESPEPNVTHLTDLQSLSRALLRELARQGQMERQPMSRRYFFQSAAETLKDMVHKLNEWMVYLTVHKLYDEMFDQVQARATDVEEVGDSVDFLLQVVVGRTIARQKNKKMQHDHHHPSEYFFHLRRLNKYLGQLFPDADIEPL